MQDHQAADLYDEATAAQLLGVKPATLKAWRDWLPLAPGAQGPVWVVGKGARAGQALYPSEALRAWVRALPTVLGVPQLPKVTRTAKPGRQPSPATAQDDALMTWVKTLPCVQNATSLPACHLSLVK